MAIHGSLLSAVQPQPAGALTPVTALATPPAGTERLVGPSEYVQPAWVTVKVRLAMVSVPVRAVALAKFELTEKVTWALPLPLGFDVRVIHGSSLAAVQAQPAVALTPVEAFGMPATGTERLPGASDKVQPAWFTVKVRPAIVSVPIRVLVLSKFEATVKATWPLPLPLGFDVIAIH